MSGGMDKLLADLVWPERSYARSTNIELDNRKPEGIPDYKFTSKSLRFLDDILDSIEGIRRDRAWSLIGPYGSGKSTFVLFLLQQLCGASSHWLERCLVQLGLASPEIQQRLSRRIIESGVRYIPIVVQGSRVPLDLALCKALFKAATDEDRDTRWVSESFLSSLNIAIQTIEAGVSDSRFIIDLYEQAANLARIGGYRGLLVAIDEFGKFLERARWQGDLPDLASAQYLAELASSLGEPQILFVVALHQGFQHYASSLSRQQWLEWVKIQGRFRQVDFNEDPQNLYGLVAASLHFKGRSRSVREELQAWASRVWNQVNTIPAFQAEGRADFWSELLVRVYPFHPIALYALPRLSAYLGQNERTLFTFLASDDPLGLKAFLNRRQENSELPSLTIDYLYDYFVTGSRFSWLPIDVQHRVAEVEAALERLGDRPAIEVRLLKAIGILGLLKAGSLMPASEQVLKAAVDCDYESSENVIRDALSRLSARKVIVYRRFAEEYRIWQGSDFDFDGALSRAREEIQSNFDLTTLIDSEVASRPILARRHSFETGTTRLFRVKLMAAADLIKMKDHHFTQMLAGYQSDGWTIYALPNNAQELGELSRWVSSISQPRVLILIPRESVGISYLILDLAALRKIRGDWPELQDDDVAMKELAARIEATEDFLDESLSVIMEPVPGGSDWYWQGVKQKVSDRRALNKLLSDVCDQVYSAAPKIRNELVNRQDFSSSVVVAVKRIIEGLLASTSEPRLGFEGNGPEISIFTAVLEEHGLYCQDVGGTWHLSRPERDEPGSLRPVWLEVERFLRSTDVNAKSLDTIHTTLQDPPYGLRKSLASFLMWIVLTYYRQIVSLYENGTYLRDWTIEIFDRFIRKPSTFTVRWLLMSRDGGNLIQRLNREVPGAAPLSDIDGRVPLNGFLRNLFGWYRSLPDFTKQTNRLSQEAKEFRSILLTVTDPIDFISEKIPNTLGLESMHSSTQHRNKAEQREYLIHYVQNFGIVMKEIDKAYPQLVNELVAILASGFDCPATITELKRLFQTMDAEITKHLAGSEARAFISRAQESQANDLLWVESVTSVLSGQAPKYWLDQHLEEFKDKLSVVVLAFNEARRSYYARTSLDHKQPHRMKRITIEEQGKLIVESYFLNEEVVGDIEEASHILLRLIKQRYPNLSQRSKEIMLAKALELVASGDKDE